MLWKGDKRFTALWVGNKRVRSLWRGAVKIWGAVTSCFGSGVWRRERPWIGTDKWKSDI